MNGFTKEVWNAAKQGPRLYFAPLLGFLQGIKSAWMQLDEYSRASTVANRTSDDDTTSEREHQP